MRNEIAAVSFGQSNQRTLDTIARTIPKIVVFLVILVVGWVVAKLMGSRRSEAYRRGQEDAARGAATPAEAPPDTEDPSSGSTTMGFGAGNTSGIA